MASNRQRALRALIACALAAVGLAACGTGSGGSGSGKSISIWEGYTGAEQKEFTRLVAQYEKANPGVKVNVLYVNNDNTLQKVLAAVRGGSQPDIAYLYGSWAPNVAKIPQVVNLTKVVQKPSVNWNDFWVGERDVATVNGKVIGIPALVDNLAVVYNKTLFAQAGLTEPAANWTWSQFQADAKALTKVVDQAVRHRLCHAGFGGHRLALGGAALGGGRPDPERLEHQGGLRLRGRPAVAEHAADHGSHRPLDVPGPGGPALRRPVQLGKDRHAGHRAMGPVRLPEREVRRAGHARVPRLERRPPDDLRP